MRKLKDKPHAERSIRYVRERFFKGGSFRDLQDCRRQAERWCREVAGLRVHGTMLRSRSLEEKATLTQEFARRMLPLFASGRLAPVIDAVYALEDVAEAHRHMEANANFGKIVLRVGDGGRP